MVENVNLKALCDKYGTKKIQQNIDDYSHKLAVLANINEKFIAVQTPEDSGGYETIVTEITNATKDYYTFIGSLPEDIKAFLLGINASTSVEDSNLKNVGIVLDKTLPINTNVLFSMQAIRPKLYTMQLDAISNQLTSLKFETQIDVAHKGNKPVITSVTLNLPENMQLEGGNTLSTYDKSIINGVNSLMESGNTAFSIPMLYHAMTGKQNPTVDQQLYDEITAKLEHMRRVMLSIDLTGEAKAEYLLDDEGKPLNVEELSIEGYLLPINKITGVVNGKKTVVYQVIQPPPLYTYSKLKRQLATAPISLLNAPISNNATTIPLKTYLLQRIELGKSRKESTEKVIILYETVYHELGVENQSKTQKMRIRRYTTTILDYFIESDYIKSYVEYKEGRSIKGLRVEI